MHLNRSVPAVSAIAAILALGATSAASTAAVPSRMVLRRADLPKGFYLVPKETGPYTNQDLVRDYGQAVADKAARLGRITGYRATYGQSNPSKGVLKGVLAVGASATLYRTSRGAHAALAVKGFGCMSRTFSAVPLGKNRPVGSDTILCGRNELVGGVPSRYVLVQWRNRTSTGALFVVGAQGTITPQTALIRARKQNRRMTAELRHR